MADMVATIRTVGRFVERHRGVILPVAVAAMIFVILVPLPAMVIDLLLIANIALAAIILLTTLYVSTPLDFRIFPSVLLVATLLRLVLNVATTRLILTAGADGCSPEEAQYAAGGVILAFSEFVTSGSLTVGVILFIMLIVIQFVVITKGAARVSEVAARFVLDAMPGKQMAIDADLKSGSIDESQSRRRRERISQEAEFYGSMDGASKFLRGDAIAALIITLINILGGMYIGMMQYGWTWPQTQNLFTRLTIGDGLVTQIPAFLIAVAAGLIVTRSTERTNLGEEVIGQLVNRPAVLIITGIFLAILTFTSLPTLPLLVLGTGCVGLAWILSRRRQSAVSDGPNRENPAPTQNVDELLNVETMKIELGYSLVRLVDAERGGDMLEKIASLRRRIAREHGLVVPPITICDSLDIGSHSYEIQIRGTKVAGGKLYPPRLLAIGDDKPGEELAGISQIEPAFGTEATWIDHLERSHAEAKGYTVVEASVVLMTHLSEIIASHSPELLNRELVVNMLENLRARSGHLVSQAVEKLGVARIQKVLQSLLGERTSIRDLETILESLCEDDVPAQNVEILIERARASLWRSLTQQYCDDDGKIWCVCLDQQLEDRIGTYVSDSPDGMTRAIPVELGRKITDAVNSGISRLKDSGRRPVVMCAPHVRATVREIISPAAGETIVLGYNEVDCNEVQSIGNVGVE